MHIIGIDSKTTQFRLTDTLTQEAEFFPGTVRGAVELNNTAAQKDYVSMSSDLNHPNEFPKFEEHAIDVAAGYFDGAVEAGLIEITDNRNENEGSDF